MKITEEEWNSLGLTSVGILLLYLRGFGKEEGEGHRQGEKKASSLTWAPRCRGGVRRVLGMLSSAVQVDPKCRPRAQGKMERAG